MTEIAITLCLILGFCALCGCASSPKVQKNNGMLTVGVTILPQADFVKAVGGNRVNVVVMLPPGADLHTYEPSAGQMVNLSRADLYIKIGTAIPFEEKYIGNLEAMNNRISVANASEGIVLLADDDGKKTHDGTADPHIWLSPKNAKIMVDNTKTALTRIDSADTSYYNQNAASYSTRLDALDREINDTFAHTLHKKFMVVHSGWRYFARDYGIEEIAIEQQGKEPGAREIANLIQTAQVDGLKVIFVDPAFSTKGAEAIAQQINGTTMVLDPMPGDYIRGVRSAADAIARSQEGTA